MSLIQKKHSLAEKNEKKSVLLYSLFFFLFILLYHFLVVTRCKPWQVNYYDYSYYLVDYSFGFCTRFFQGALYHLFFKDAAYRHVNLFLNILLFLVFALISFLLSKIIVSQSNQEIRRSLIILFVFFLIGNGTFAMLTYNPGLPELYWVIFTVFFIMIIAKKYLRFCIPLVLFLCILVHFSCVLSFAVFFFALLFYEAAKAESKKEKRVYLSIIVLTAIVALTALLYFLVFEKGNLTYNYEEFLQQLEAKNQFPGDEPAYSLYFAGNLYRKGEFHGRSIDEVLASLSIIDPAHTSLPPILVKLINVFVQQLRFHFMLYSAHAESYLMPFSLTALVCSPFIIVFYLYWRGKLKTKESFLQKIPYLIMLLQFPLAVSGVIFSTDMTRWFAHAFMLQFAGYIYLCYREGDLENFMNSFLYRIDYRYLVFYMICYGALIFDPYNPFI